MTTIASKSLQLPRNNIKSKFYYIAFAIIILGFAIFFNSKYIMPDDTPIYNTTLGKTFELGGTSFYIKRWEYNKNKDFMEVEIKYNEGDSSLSSNLKFSAVPKVNVKKQLPIKTVLTTDNAYILHIDNIPKKYGAVSIKVFQDTSIDGGNTDDSNNKVALYCDYRRVKINDNLKEKSKKDYLIEVTKEDIKTYKNKIASDNKKIASNKKLLDTVNRKINDLDEQYKYEVEDEQKTTTDKINSLQGKINEINRDNDKLFQDEKTNNEKIEKLKTKLSDISK